MAARAYEVVLERGHLHDHVSQSGEEEGSAAP